MYYLYVIKAATDPIYYKIGISNRPHHRLCILQTGSPAELELMHLLPCGDRGNARDIEKEWHAFFRAKHHRGEWFQIHEADIVELIKAIYEDEDPPPSCIRQYSRGRLGRALALNADTDEIVRVRKLKI